MGINQVRLERLADERQRTERNIEEVRQLAEGEERELSEFETEQVERWRTQLAAYDTEINVLAEDIEREQNARDVSALIRTDTPHNQAPPVPVVQVGENRVVYRTFAAYARDRLITEYDQIANLVHGPEQASIVRQQAQERLERTIQDTLSTDVPGLLPPQHMAQILDIIDASRPVVATARRVDLERGKLTYPKIAQRPTVSRQTSEKTEAGTANMQITLEDITAYTYLGAGDLSWQTINWSTPSALQLWFDLAAEAYARQTEARACEVLEAAAAGLGTAATSLGTAGTEDFAAWTAATISGIAGIYSATSGRARTNTLYLSASRFFQLAGLGTESTLQVSQVGALNIESMTGTWKGLRVVGSYGFTNANTAIVGDGGALLVGETAGAPVEMRAVEPSIGGMEVGIIGAFQAQVFDTDRFIKLT